MRRHLPRGALFATLIALCWGCGDANVAVCSGSIEFCNSVNSVAPEAEAGPDRSVPAGDTVTLDASASRAPGSAIRSYSWAQTGGPAQTLSGATAARATFVASDVAETTDVTFRVTVVNERGTADTDTVTITIEPLETAAVRAASELVAVDLLPAVLDAPAGCFAPTRASVAAERAIVGMWLSARVRSVGDDPVATSDLLDQARRVSTVLAEAQTRGIEEAFVANGARELATFAAHRDPALAEAARRAANGSDVDVVPKVRKGLARPIERDGALALQPERTDLQSAMRAVIGTHANCGAAEGRIAADRLRLMALVSRVLATPAERSAAAPAATIP